MKLNIKAFALTCGLLWAVSVFLLTWWVIAFEGATGEATLLGKFYRGYNISALGSVIGGLWALVDGLLGGAILAWMYNALSDRIGPRTAT